MQGMKKRMKRGGSALKGGQKKLDKNKDGKMSKRLIDECYELLNNDKKRVQVVKHNLKVLRSKLSHEVIGQSLSEMIKNIFTYY